MKRFALLLLVLLPAISPLQAQKELSWRKHLKKADNLYRKAQYTEAARHYGAAFGKKPKKLDIAYKAGECYFIIKDYEKAANFLQHVKHKDKFYPMVGYKYAQSLKQAGHYHEASSEFAAFIESYKGPDRDQITHQVENEILGCELGLALELKEPENAATINHLGNQVNTPFTEFAPIPFSDDILYFSSTMGDRAKIYRTQRADGTWTKATLPASFPVIEEDHFCNGSLSADNKRFYFTICKPIESWGGLTTRCEIFVTKRSGTSWAEPIRLSEYINPNNATTTHPFVTVNGNTETVYFASNRKGGFGGMDIWYMTRDVNSTSIDFTQPINAGPTINTAQDEITPYYDEDEASLYFSSNGHLSIGGYDIFRAVGSRSQWEEAKNLGKPFNTSADDYFYIKAPSRQKGFLVSNRTAEGSKNTTTHEDIFEFTLLDAEEIRPIASGEIFDNETGAPLMVATVALFEISVDGEKTPHTLQEVTNGKYHFTLKMDRNYIIEAEAEGYLSTSMPFNTGQIRSDRQYGKTIFLKRIPSERPVEAPPLEKEEKKEEKPKNENDRQEVITDAPRNQGTYFKIQLIATGKFNESQSRYNNVRDLGRLDTELIADRNLTRVLLAQYDTLEDARDTLGKVKTDFPGAYIVKYEDGQRVRRVN